MNDGQELHDSPEPQKKSVRPDSIIISAQGRPFRTEAAARAALINKRLEERKHRVVPFEDGEESGFAIERIEARAPLETEDGPSLLAKERKVKGERYFWVKFFNKMRHTDTDRIVLGHNGDILDIGREIAVPIPERFMRVADDSIEIHYSQKPGEPRKIAAKIPSAPYTVIGEASREEYLDFLEKGTKDTMAKTVVSDNLAGMI